MDPEVVQRRLVCRRHSFRKARLVLGRLSYQAWKRERQAEITDPPGLPPTMEVPVAKNSIRKHTPFCRRWALRTWRGRGRGRVTGFQPVFLGSSPVVSTRGGLPDEHRLLLLPAHICLFRAVMLRPMPGRPVPLGYGAPFAIRLEGPLAYARGSGTARRSRFPTRPHTPHPTPYPHMR